LSRLHSQKGICLNLVKALPHASGKYFETVCCAGITPQGEWVRQHPVPYRTLADPQQFRRWDIIRYQYTEPGHDGRKETQRVDPDSLTVMRRSSKEKERDSLNAIIRSSTDEAATRGESLALLRPTMFEFSWKAKTSNILEKERNNHLILAKQDNLFHAPVKPMTPCPYTFHIKWTDAVGKSHMNTCEDWETSATFARRRNEMGNDEAALSWLKEKYEVEYAQNGVTFAMGTHALHQQTWLLVGIIRLDHSDETDLFGT